MSTKECKSRTIADFLLFLLVCLLLHCARPPHLFQQEGTQLSPPFPLRRTAIPCGKKGEGKMKEGKKSTREENHMKRKEAKA